MTKLFDGVAISEEPEITAAMDILKPTEKPVISAKLMDWLGERIGDALRGRMASGEYKESAELLNELTMLFVLRGNIIEGGGMLSNLDNASLAEHVGIISYLIDPWSMEEVGL